MTIHGIPFEMGKRYLKKKFKKHIMLKEYTK